jgi:periplasmic protein TonB
MRQQESVPAPRGWTGRAAWSGAGASLLLHLFVGAAMILALSGPPKGPPQVIDLTLLPPVGIARSPVPAPFVSTVKPSRVSGTDVPSDPPVLPASQPVANPPEATAPASPSAAAAYMGDPAPGSPHAPAGATVPADQGTVKSGPGGSPGIPGAPSPTSAEFAWIRDAIQGAISYPATARRMGWEGNVVVAFQLLSDGSVRDVRVVQGSGYAALDRGAIDAVRNASPFPRSPVEAEVITPVVYRLTTR